MRGQLGNLLQELKERRVLRVAAAYVAAAFVFLQAADLLLPALDLPAWTFRALVAASAIGLPVALVLSWVFDITPAGLQVASGRAAPSRPHSGPAIVGDAAAGDERGGRTGLPAQLTPLIGRHEELDRAERLLLNDHVRLLTLTGPGGSGKTRLAAELAHRIAGRFEAGARMVMLAPLRSPESILPTIARELGGVFSGARSLLDELQDYLAPKSLLLVLDNFEHLLDGAHTISALLAAAPRLSVVVTSRSPLRIRGEHQLAIPPLALPDAETDPDLDEIARYDAVALLLERARAVDSGIVLSAKNATTLVDICRRLDGLPLAIELAAARLDVLTPQVLLERLAGSLGELSSDLRDLPSRQQTLINTIAWSYELLDERGQALLRAVSTFVGGFGIDAATAVGCRMPGSDPAPVDELAHLVRHSLVKKREGAGGAPRFELLETIREFGQDASLRAGEDSLLRYRHAAYYYALARESADHIERQDQFYWLDRLTEEHGNFQAALQWFDGQGDPERVLAMAGALWRYWWVHAHVNEGRAWLERAVDAHDVTAATRALALTGAANLAAFQAELPRAHQLGVEALRLYRESGDGRSVAIALGTLGKIALLRGELDAGQAYIEEGLELARAAVDRWTTARALNDLGEIARVRGDAQSALRYYEESLEVGSGLGTQQSASTMYNLGAIHLLQGQHAAAAEVLARGFSLACRLGDKRGIANGMEYLAGVWAARGEFDRAARLLGRAGALRESINVPLESVDRVIYDHAVTITRSGLSAESFDSMLSVGRKLPLSIACAEALGTG